MLLRALEASAVQLRQTLAAELLPAPDPPRARRYACNNHNQKNHVAI